MLRRQEFALVQAQAAETEVEQCHLCRLRHRTRRGRIRPDMNAPT